jgi:hypothetical protein
MRTQITSAFAQRQRPKTVTTITVNSELRDDALHFDGMDWSQVVAEDWRHWSDAISGFTPDAFLYFLPSLLIVSLDKSNLPLVAADVLISLLATSADPEIWHEHFSKRFQKLSLLELKALKDWTYIYLEGEPTTEGSDFARVQETIVLLELMLENQ